MKMRSRIKCSRLMINTWRTLILLWKLILIWTFLRSLILENILKLRRNHMRKRRRLKMPLLLPFRWLKRQLWEILRNIRLLSWKTQIRIERCFGSRNLVGLSLQKIILLLEVKMLSKMRCLWRSTWIKEIYSSIVSFMVLLYVFLKIHLEELCHLCLSKNVHALRFVIVLHGQTMFWVKYTG